MVAIPRPDEYRLMSLSLTVEATTMITPSTPGGHHDIGHVIGARGMSQNDGDRFMPSSPKNVPISVIQNTCVPFFR